MEKNIQILAVIALISATNSYASWLDTVKSWFTPQPGPEYKELAVHRYDQIVETRKGLDIRPVSTSVTVPVEKIDPTKTYKAIRLGNRVYYKEVPTPTDIPTSALTVPVEKEMETFYGEQPLWRRLLTPSWRMTPLIPGYKYYVTTKSSDGPTLSIVKKQPKISPEAKKAFARTQMTE